MALPSLSMCACLNMKDLKFFIILEETDKQNDKTTPKTKQEKTMQKSTASLEFWLEALLGFFHLWSFINMKHVPAANQPVIGFCFHMGRLNSMVIQTTAGPQPLLHDWEEVADRVLGFEKSSCISWSSYAWLLLDGEALVLLPGLETCSLFLFVYPSLKIDFFLVLC